MGIVKISDELHKSAKCMASAMHRSINAQAEYWMRIGKLVEENPTITFQQVREIFMQQALTENANYVDQDS